MNRNLNSLLFCIIFAVPMAFLWMYLGQHFHWERMIAYGFWGNFLLSFIGATLAELIKRIHEYYTQRKSKA